MQASPPPRLRELQYAFAAHIRDPAQVPTPSGVPERRMQVYRELFYNSLAGLLSGNFPVIQRLLDGPRWQALVRDFFRDYRAQTPLFPEIAREFLRYLEQREAQPDDPPFLQELAHYEWIELQLAIDPQEPDLSGVVVDADLMAHEPILNPVLRVLGYRFPVHQIRPDHQPSEPPEQPSFLAVWRDAQYKIRFMELNAITARLLECLRDGQGSGRERLLALSAELPQIAPEVLLAHGQQTLERLQREGIVLGARLTH